jgi:cell shape-determining protein MreC
LISDPQSRIAAHIFDKKSRLAGGVLAGAEHSGLCEMKFIEDRPGLQIQKDQYVVTAGTDGIIPEGLILGVITKAERGRDSDNWHIIVQPLRPVHAVTELIVGRQPVPASGH